MALQQHTKQYPILPIPDLSRLLAPQSYPDQAAAYMLLSEGYVHRAKIAYHVPGEPVTGWERLALDAAIHAATLDFENGEAQGLVKNCRARLSKLASK